MANLLKKVTINPLQNFERWESLRAYENASNDEELADVLHGILDKEEGNDLLTSMTYGLICYATDCNINAQMLIL